jgi:hypothetical protein
MESNVRAGVTMMNHKFWKFFFLLFLLLLPVLVINTPVQAGDPDDTIGPPNNNLLVCATADHLVFPLDSDAFGGEVDGEATSLSEFDPDKKVDAQRLENDCEEADELLKDIGLDFNLRVEYLRQTRIEGYVFEFHPNPGAPGGWMAVPSRDVPVVASGPGFEIVWGSEKDGQYFFDYLGAGPITLNLRLPPGAHPINPDIIVMSRSFLDTWDVDLGFYRGDYPPPHVDEISLPPEYPRSKLVPADTIIEVDEDTGQIVMMPNVGGVLPLEQPVATITLAALLLIILPAAGIHRVRRQRREP